MIPADAQAIDRDTDHAILDLGDAYRTCLRIAAEHGRTYYLATRLLTPDRRRAVHALYAFARIVDDIVDHAESDRGPLHSAERHRVPAHASPIRYSDTASATGPDPDTDGDAWSRTRQTGERADAASPIGSDRDTISRARQGDELTHAGSAARPEAHATQPRTAGRGVAAADRVDRIELRLRAALAGDNDPYPDADDPVHTEVLFAVTDTIHRHGVDVGHIWTFLDSMRMDIPGAPQFRTRYPTMSDLREYMRGSAAAIGLQLLPVLGTVVPTPEAEPAAAALGEAFQLTNFLRDVGEDLDRGRIYLPTEVLTAFDVTEEMLTHCRTAGHPTPQIRRALAHLIAVNRDVYRKAAPGIALLTPRVRPAIRTASTLYADILTRIESANHNVFAGRARVPRRRRIRIATTEFATAPLRDRSRPSAPPARPGD
ncbi:phytoene/squalene synthase family protein [Nocardia arizonensis]|uniref:phytoene/squalene synthase family protein n=1 Tax=Nocardia arizonensis TaxID=1141647 RepID=UPI000AB829DC|nr:phytoene/squalene synthase family protein [Nocardia arizonensis]